MEICHGVVTSETTIPGTRGSAWECVNIPWRLPSSCLEHAIGSGSIAPDRAAPSAEPLRATAADKPGPAGQAGCRLTPDSQVVSLEIHSRKKSTRFSIFRISFRKEIWKIKKIGLLDSRDQNKNLNVFSICLYDQCFLYKPSFRSS